MSPHIQSPWKVTHRKQKVHKKYDHRNVNFRLTKATARDGVSVVY